MYVGIGSATNSGVAGLDDYMLGWLANNPTGHDIPGMNMTLAGQNFVPILLSFCIFPRTWRYPF
jgi:hypothetical protein